MALMIENPREEEEVIDDVEVFRITDAFDGAKPEEQEIMRQKLARYIQTKEAREAKELAARTRRMYADLDTLGGEYTGDTKARFEELNEGVLDIGAAKAASVNSLLLSNYYQDAGDADYVTLKNRYAKEKWGKATISDTEFYSRQKADFDLEDAQEADRSKLIGSVVSKDLEAVAGGVRLATADLISGWMKTVPPENLKGIDKGALIQQVEAFRAESAPYVAKANQILDVLGKWTGSTTGNNPKAGGKEVDQLAADLVTMPQKELEKVVQLVAITAEERQLGDTKGVAVKLLESFGRGLADITGKTTLALQEQDILQRIKILKGGNVRLRDGEATLGNVLSPEQAKTTAGVVSGITGATMQEAREATEEEKDALLIEAGRLYKQAGMLRQLRAIADGVVDPIEAAREGFAGLVEGGLYGAARSAPYTLTALVPGAGMALTAGAIWGGEYDRMRLAYPNMAPDAVGSLALASAALQAPVEWVQSRALMGKLPATSALLKRMSDVRLPLPARVGAAVGGNIIEQNAQEWVQDSVPLVIDSIAAAVRSDMPEFDMEAAFRGLSDSRIDTFFALLPLALIGGGAATYREFKRGEVFTADKYTLRVNGFSEKAAAEIAAEPNPDARDSMIQQRWNARSLDDIKAGQALARKDAEAFQRQQDDATRPTIREVVSPTKLDDDGNPLREYIVSEPAGREIWRTTNIAEAQDALQGALEASLDNSTSAVRNLIRFYEGQAKGEGRHVEYSIENAPKTVADFLEANPESVEQLRDRMAIEGLEGADPASVAILGETTVEQLREDVFKTTIRLYEGADAMTVVEETVEGKTREALAAGRVTMKWLHDQVSAYEAATGEKLLTGTDQSVIEAVSTLGVAMFGGRVQERALPAGLRSFFRQLAIFFRAVFQRAAQFRKAVAEGKVSGEFEEFLADSIGIPVERQQIEREASAKEALLDGEKESASANDSGRETFSIRAASEINRRADEPVEIINGRDRYPSLNAKEVYEFARDAGNGILGEHENPDTGLRWNVSVSSLNKMVKQGAKPGEPDGARLARTAATYHLPDLIRAAKGFEVEDARGDGNVDRLFDLYSAFEWRGELYRIRIKGKASGHQGNKAHSMRVEDIIAKKMPLEGKISAPTTEDQPVNTTATSGDITIRQLFKAVNPYSGVSFSLRSKADLDKIEARLRKLDNAPEERRKSIDQAIVWLRNIEQWRDQAETGKLGEFTRSTVDLASSLARLEAIKSILPPEARGRITPGQSMVAMAPAQRVEFLKKRVTEVGKALERWLRKDYRTRIEDLLEKTRPQRSEGGVKKSNLGPEAQAYVDKVRVATYKDEDATSERMDEITAAMNAGDTSLDLAEEWAILNTFGDLSNRSAETLAEGLKGLKEIIRAGRSEWRMVQDERFARSREAQAQIVQLLGRTDLPESFSNEHKKWLERASDLGTEFLNDHISFEQFLRAVIPPSMEDLIKGFSDRMRRADNAVQDTEIRDRKALLEVLRAAAKVEKKSTAQALVDLKKMHADVAKVLVGRKIENVRLTIEQANKIVKGEADRGKLRDRDIVDLRNELAALPKNSRKEYITLQRVIDSGSLEDISMSRGQAIQVVLSWEQSDVQDKMRRGGWLDDSIADLRKFIAGDHVAVEAFEFLKDYYRGGSGKVNPVYARMFGMNMPQVRNYAPTRFKHAGDVKDIGPEGQPTANGTTPGFAKSRVTHSAPIAPADALEVFSEQVAQQAHWVEFAELARDFRAIFSNGEVRRSIESAHSPKVLAQIDKWTRLMEQRGGDRARESAWMNQAVGSLIAGRAVASLGFNLKTVALQMDSAMRFLFAMEPRQIIDAFSDPGKLAESMPKVWNSDSVQRRLMGGMNPEMQFLFRRAAAKPGLGAVIAHASTAPINFMDAVFTTIGSAAVYKSAYEEAKAAGANDTIAEKHALDQLDAAIYRFSQPVGFGSKSLAENSGGTLFRIYMMFLSDARLKSGIMLEAARGLASGDGKAGQHIKNILLVEAMAMISHIIASAYRDAFSDDDDEDIWSAGGFAKAALLAPFQGLFFVGAVTDSLLSFLTKEQFFTPSRDPLIDAAQRGQRVARNWDDTLDFRDPEAMRKQWENIARAMALSPQAAAPAALLNLTKPIIGLKENIESED